MSWRRQPAFMYFYILHYLWRKGILSSSGRMQNPEELKIDPFYMPIIAESLSELI